MKPLVAHDEYSDRPNALRVQTLGHDFNDMRMSINQRYESAAVTLSRKDAGALRDWLSAWLATPPGPL